MLELNRAQSHEYKSKKAIEWRRRYRSEHPTAIADTECMDGRVHVPLAAGFPAGVFFTFQSLGGAFDFSVPYFGETLRLWIEQAIAQKRDALILNTYHFSKGDTHRGCAGYGYDTQAALAGTEKLRAELASVFAKGKSSVFVVLLGIETDEDAFVVHSKKGKFSVADDLDISQKDLLVKLGALFPDMPPRVVRDLAFLLEGNIRHVKELRARPRTVTQMIHGEQVIAVGRGLSWIHEYNRALCIGPWTNDLGGAVSTAAGIVFGSLKAGRIPKEEGALLLISAQCADGSSLALALAQEEARALMKYCLGVITERVPDLTKSLTVLAGTFDPKTRLFTPLE